MFTQTYGEDMMTVRGERGRPLHACVIIHNSSVRTMHTIVFSFTMFTATIVLCNSIEDYIKLEISRNNHPGNLTNYQ